MKSCRGWAQAGRSEEHTSELQSLRHLVCRLLLEKKKKSAAEPTETTNQATAPLSHVTAVEWVERRGEVLPAASSWCDVHFLFFFSFFFFNDTATTEIYTLSLHDAFPIYSADYRAPRGFRACLRAPHAAD